MRVLVLGSGVIGTASAYYLARAGFEVVVVDRQPGPALETSFANGGARVGDFTDGLSNTIGFAEVKAYGAYMLGGTPTATPPSTPATQLALGGALKTLSAHTGWTEGQTFHNGVTFALTPSTVVSFTDASGTYDVD